MARTITGTILKPDGTAWAGGILKFQLIEAFETSTTVYPKYTHEEILDAQGEFTIDLEVPDTGTAWYYIRTPDSVVYDVQIGAGAATNLQTILTIATTTVVQNDLQTLIDANNVITMTDVSAAYDILSSDEGIFCTGTFTVTLPAATGSGKPYMIKSITATITLSAQAGETIDGSLTQTIYVLSWLTVVDHSTGVWYIV